MKSKLLYSALLFMSTFVLFAQNEHFICGFEEDPNTPVYFSPFNTSSYSGSIDPSYLASFEPISFDIYFWIINPEDENISYTPVTYQHIKANLIRVNELFKPMGICFVLKGYDYIKNDALFEGATSGQINSYGKVVNNCFNVYIPKFFIVNTPTGISMPNGMTSSGSNKMYFKRTHFNGNTWGWGTIAGNVLAHELAHTFDLKHPWGTGNNVGVTSEHVTRNPNDPNYNALSVADFIHDTPAMVSFWAEKEEEDSIYTIVDPETCEYLGNGTDNLGVPFELTPTDAGNIMAYGLSHCQVGFTTGQGIRIREWIAIPSNANRPSILAMRNDNLPIDLYIKDNPDDFGEEPNITSDILWNSPNIWVRHINDDGLVHQNPEYDSNLSNYVYVRVTNRGCSASSGDDILKLYWSKAATAMSWDSHWNGSHFENDTINQPKRGDFIGQVNIPVIESGEEKIIAVEWNNIPNPADYIGINPEPWHFCLLARIESVDDPISVETASTGSNVKKNNNIAQKNITIVDVNPNSGGKLGGVIAVGNPFNTPRNFTLNLVADNRETGKKIFEEAEVGVTLDHNLFNIWVNGGKQGNNIIQRGGTTLMITGDNASLDNLVFRENEFATLNLKFNFLTQEVTQKEVFTYHVIQKESSNNEIIGGETYEIRKDPRALFFADAGNDKQVDKNEPVTLNAEMLNESAVYNWYDSEGNLIYEGASFTTSVEIGQKYKLEVITLADGYKDYTEIEVKLKPNSIETMYPNPASNQVTVAYKINEGDSAYLSVNSLYSQNTVSYNYVLDITENDITLDVSNYPQGTYAIALIVNGQIQDTTTLIKQ